MPTSGSFRGPQHDLTNGIIKAFYDLYNDLGHGLPEVVYHRAMKVEMDFRGLSFRTEVPFALTHRGVNIGDYRADLIINSRVIVECKAIEKIAPVHISQVVTYLKATGLRTALILNFGPKPDVRRVDR